MKTPSLQVVCNGILVLLCALLSSCGSKKDSATSDTPTSPPPFDKTMFSEVTPMLDGSAYAISFDSRLWYLRGSKAVPVTVLGDASQKLPDFPEITPVLDGSAYATFLGGEAGLWYLHAEHAEKVTEVSSLADSGAPLRISDRAFSALYFSEREKRKDAQYRLDNPEEFVDRDPPERPF